MPFTPEQHKAYRAKMKAKNICTKCHKNKTEKGSSICCECYKQHKELRRKRFESGICRDCGGPLDDATIRKCVNCSALSYQKEYWRRRKI